MKKLFAVSALLFALFVPVLAQAQRQLSPEDQRRFDSYYSRWQEYRRTNNRDEAASMEKRMGDVYAHYAIPSDTPYWQVASNGHSDSDGDWDDRDRDGDRDRDRDGDHDRGLHRGWDKHDRDDDGDRDRDSGRNRWRGRLSVGDTSWFDSYYTRSLHSRRDNNREQISSMEKRMWDLMDHNNIPREVPFGEIASRR